MRAFSLEFRLVLRVHDDMARDLLKSLLYLVDNDRLIDVPYTVGASFWASALWISLI